MIQPLNFSLYEILDFPHQNYSRDSEEHTEALKKWHNDAYFAQKRFKLALENNLTERLVEMGAVSIDLNKIRKAIAIAESHSNSNEKIFKLVVDILPLILAK